MSLTRQTKFVVLCICVGMVLSLSTGATAQFTIKIPKIKTSKPQPESPTSSSTDTAPSTSPSNSTETPVQTNANRKGSFDILPRQQAPNKPVFMLQSLLIRAKTEPRYYKAPNVNDNTSWYPQVEFQAFYDDSVKQRFVAEWFNPDGSLWYSDPLEAPFSNDDLLTVRSADSTEQLSSHAVQTVGTYGLKVTDSKTNQVVFQGKFTVKKLQPELDLKKKYLYYVDNDWNLPIGYADFYDGSGRFENETYPRVKMYFKGEQDSKDFEARLFYNDQQIASTDEGGRIFNDGVRGDECYQFRATCQLTLWTFTWDKFQLANNDWVRRKWPNAIFTRDKPGEYTAKIYYRGAQVREAKFTIDQKGWISQGTYADRIFPYRYTAVVPVKVMGNLDKWNPATWKTDAFYGNPLAGFNVQ